MPFEHELWFKTNGKEGHQLNLTGSDFSGKDLEDSIMIKVNFDGANLSDVNLAYSNLNYSSFKGTNLRNSFIIKAEADHANFEGANLSNCNLLRTSFIETSFREADLTNADLSLTLLKDVDFSNAILDKCNFSDVSLFGAKGLEAVKLEWINIGENEKGKPNILWGAEAIKWLLTEAEKPI